MKRPSNHRSLRERGDLRWKTVVRRAIPLLLIPLAGCASNVTTQQLSEEYFNIGNAFFELGEYEKSFEYYERAVALSNELPAIGYNLARLYERQGEYEQSLQVLDQLLKEDPLNGLVRETRAFVLYKAQRVEESRQAYRELLQVYPARARLRFNIGTLELEEDRVEEAFLALIEGEQYAEEDGEYLWLLSEAAYRSERVEQALAVSERYRTVSADSAQDLTKLALRYVEWDRNDAALDVIDEIGSAAEEDPQLLFARASILLRGSDDFDGGVEVLQAALDKGYDHTEEAYEELLSALSVQERDLLTERIQLPQKDEADDDQDGEEETESDEDSSEDDG